MRRAVVYSGFLFISLVVAVLYIEFIVWRIYWLNNGPHLEIVHFDKKADNYMNNLSRWSIILL